MIKKLIGCLRAIFRKSPKKETCGCARHNENRQDDARIAGILSRLEAVEHRLDDSVNMVGGVDASEFLNRLQMLEDKINEFEENVKKVQKEN